MNIKVIILAGWSGTRLWPLSRKYYPKQFLKLKEFDNKSFYQMAFERANQLTSIENIYTITNDNYKFHCLNQSNILEKNIIIEPEAKNTLWAISLWVEKWDNNDIFVVLSSDHLIKEEDIFIDLIRKSADAAKNSIIVFWIKPNSPHTWYWYIEFDKKWEFPFQVLNFKEKPNLENAKEYVEKWYYWNAGFFMFSKEIFINELKKNNKEYYELIKDWVLKNFGNLPDLSIDYWLLEKTKNIKVTPMDIYWNDLGGFDAFYDYIKKNNIKQELTEVDANNNLALTENSNKEVAFVGVDDLIVIDTKDAILISKKWETQKVKNVLEKLKEKNKYHADYWTTVYRPWGSYSIVDEWVWFKTKRLTVLPWKRLSGQMHHHRSEHWVVVSWTAKISLDDKVVLLSKWESTYIPIWTTHRLENPWKVDLHIIESQIWDYLEEDDIIRFDDDFWRV